MSVRPFNNKDEVHEYTYAYIHTYMHAYIHAYTHTHVHTYTNVSILRKEREREMFYLTTHSTHFIYGYMASDIWLRTILVVRKETRCRHIGYSYRLTARVLLYAYPTDRITHTTARRPIAPWANALPLRYVPLLYIKERGLWCDGSSDLSSWPIELFLDWYNKDRGMCYPLCGMVHMNVL